jgi:hypothetical protein
MVPRRRCKLLLGTDREPRSRGHGHAPLAVASRLHSCCSMYALPAPAVARRAAAARRHTPGWRQLALAAAAARLVVAGCRTAASASHTSRTGYDFHEWTLGRRRCRRERRDGRWGEDRCVLQWACQNVANFLAKTWHSGLVVRLVWYGSKFVVKTQEKVALNITDATLEFFIFILSRFCKNI